MTTEKTIPDDLKTLADAYTLNNQASNRIWTFVAILTLIVAGGAAELFGASLDQELFPWLGLMILSAGNLAYVSAQLQGFHTGQIYRDYLEAIGGRATTLPAGREDVKAAVLTLENAAHSLYWPNLNRLYPVSHALPGNRALRVAVSLAKFAFDTLFCAVPIAGMVLSFYAVLGQVIQRPAPFEIVTLAALSLFALISIAGTVLLLVRAFVWDAAALKRSLT